MRGPSCSSALPQGSAAPQLHADCADSCHEHSLSHVLLVQMYKLLPKHLPAGVPHLVNAAVRGSQASQVSTGIFMLFGTVCPCIWTPFCLLSLQPLQGFHSGCHSAANLRHAFHSIVHLAHRLLFEAIDR